MMMMAVVLSFYANEQLKPAYTECREVKGQCDLSEYCSGSDPVCPSDVYRRNTASCTVDAVRQRSSLLFIVMFHITWAEPGFRKEGSLTKILRDGSLLLGSRVESPPEAAVVIFCKILR